MKVIDGGESKESRVSNSSFSPNALSAAASQEMFPTTSTAVDFSFLDDGFLSLIHGTNAQLKTFVDKDENRKCVALNIGSQSDELTYYNPYIRVLFVSKGVDGWNHDKKSAVEAGPVYPANPFTDDLRILHLSMEADMTADSSGLAIINQDVLRLLFDSDEILTYNLISERMNQWPEIKMSAGPEFQYYPRIAYRFPEEYDEPILINGAVGYVEYFVRDIRIRVHYLKNEDIFIAYEVFLESLDSSWIENWPY